MGWLPTSAANLCGLPERLMILVISPKRKLAASVGCKPGRAVGRQSALLFVGKQPVGFAGESSLQLAANGRRGGAAHWTANSRSRGRAFSPRASPLRARPWPRAGARPPGRRDPSMRGCAAPARMRRVLRATAAPRGEPGLRPGRLPADLVLSLHGLFKLGFYSLAGSLLQSIATALRTGRWCRFNRSS